MYRRHRGQITQIRIADERRRTHVPQHGLLSARRGTKKSNQMIKVDGIRGPQHPPLPRR